MVVLPPVDESDGEGWVKALLSDLAGRPDNAAELLEAVWDVQSKRITEWSMHYNAYGVAIRPDGARVEFNDDSSTVGLELLAGVVVEHLGWKR